MILVGSEDSIRADVMIARIKKRMCTSCNYHLRKQNGMRKTKGCFVVWEGEAVPFRFSLFLSQRETFNKFGWFHANASPYDYLSSILFIYLFLCRPTAHNNAAPAPLVPLFHHAKSLPFLLNNNNNNNCNLIFIYL